MNKGAGMAKVGEKTIPRFRKFILDVSAFCAIVHRCAKLQHTPLF